MITKINNQKLCGLNENETKFLDISQEKNTLKVFEAFCGIGAQHMALHWLSMSYPWFKFQVIGISEINKDAIMIYQKLFGKNIPNYGNIKEINWNEVPDFELFTYSSPCQDISQTGTQKGFKKGSGTQSALLWECEDAIRIKRPRYLLMENVKNILAPKFSNEFNDWFKFLETEGYTSFYKILDAKDFGVPQHRERFFMVSILGGYNDFTFPQGTKQMYDTSDFLDKNILNNYRIAS